jgi:signal transduction histidine kinase
LLGANTDSSLISTLLFFGTILTLLFGVPIACALAILRYRLYDLDIVVRKTVIYATLVGLIVVLAGLALLVTGAFVVGPISNASIAIFGAGVVVGVLFIPLRRVATRVADRAVYGKRATPYEVLAQFSDRMADTYASDDVLSRMAQVLGSGTGASAARVWLRVGGELRPDAVWPPGAPATPPVATAADALPPLPDVGYAVEVRHQGELLGALSVAMPPDDPMTPSRERLVNDLASQAGLVLRNVRLIEELRSSRQRLVAAQDEERRKLERNIHDGAQQQLVALSVKLRLAEAMVGKDPDKERALLSDLQAATTDALEDLRDLARGIYPPLLADKGLAAALEAQARRSPVPVQIAPDGVGRFAPDVESAVYFCCLEALNNVAKYANASLVRIRLAAEDGALTFDVVDDGDGFDAATAAAGTGLQGMADRLDAIGGTLEIRSEPSRGTEVRGRVPAAPQP